MGTLLALVLGFSNGCGVPPVPPQGFYYVCACDSMGNNCQLILVEKRK